MTAPPRFDLRDDLPSGRLAIEASAGTGKTYTLAGLATRYLAEWDMATTDLLLVTFTRAATAELRTKVRDRLVGAVEHLSHGGPTEDELLQRLAATDREQRLARLQQAVTEFDAATITTIHGFATQVLATLGIASGADPDATLVDDSAQLAAECCADVLAAAALDHAELPGFTSLVQRTRTAINIADLRLAPGADQPTATPADRRVVELVQESIDRMRRRRRESATLSFDDVLVELRRALVSSGGGATEALRNRYKVALIDEFQDTDPVQWDIFRTMFPETTSTDSALVLVGDPKQSIYAFRGANVHTYLSAVHGSGATPPSLDVNWRSDGAVLRATSALLRGVTFGDERIGFTEVDAAPTHGERRLLDASGAPLPALSIRLALGPSIGRTKAGKVAVPDGRLAVVADLVEQLRALLDGAQLPDPERPVRPSDIAVLVRTNSEAELVRDALREQGIPAVLARGGSVLDSSAAEQWRWLLDAMARPSDPGRARTFALSWFGGLRPEWVATATDEDLVGLQEQLMEWAAVLVEHGVVEFQRRLWSDCEVVARVLARPDGDRELTDLEHVAELLGTASGGAHHSVAGLLSVLDAPAPVEIEADVDRDKASRRVESEAKAVQIMTVWVAKGLEFPIVCVPTMWCSGTPPRIVPDGVDGARMYDLAGSPWPDKAATNDRKRLAEAEALGENLRLLYVALTRAQHQTILWWSSTRDSPKTGLCRVLFARDEHGAIDPELFAAASVPPPDDEECLGFLQPLERAAGGTLSLEVHDVPARAVDRWVDTTAETGEPELELAELHRRPDRTRRRWSFTAISAGDAHHPDPFDPSAGDAGAADEPTPDAELEPDPSSGAAAPAPDASAPGLASLPAGASFGTLVHSVLEVVDFTADDLDEQLRQEAERQLQRRPVDLAPRAADGTRGDPSRGLDLLVDGLRAAVDTPLGSLFDDQPLRRLGRADRLDEMSFDLRLGDGPRPATDADLGRVIEAHLAPSNLFDHQPLHTWAQGLVDGRFGAILTGHLTGSIDAVLRVRDDHGRPRFVVVDYKTNRLTPPGQRAAAGDYAPERLAAAMAEHHYPLQALLYTVALHRYLRWRLPGYDPEVHLGGVAYLFLRGMIGAATAVSDGERHGVFSWRVPSGLVTDLSDLLDGRLAPGTVR